MPHSTHRSHDDERRDYDEFIVANDGLLAAGIYHNIWADLLPNERLAIESLSYDDLAVVAEDTGFYREIHAYIAAKNHSDSKLTKQHMQNAIWEIIYNSLPDKSTIISILPELFYDQTKHRRKEQAIMLNSLNLPLIETHTPDYIIEPIRQQYAATSLEELLPDIVFPLEDNARKIAEEIQAINAQMQQDLLGQKSAITQAENNQQASNAFVELYTKIIEEGARAVIDREIERSLAKGYTAQQIQRHVMNALERFENVSIPHKMQMLTGHFKGTLSALEQQEAGITHYIWRSQDDGDVRNNHAEYHDHLFAWANPPEGGHPGEDYNCRCYAEPFSSDAIDESIIGPDLLIPAAASLKIALASGKALLATLMKVFKNPIARRPKGVPKDWRKVPNKKGEGYTYKNPKTKDGGTYVKVSKGDPKSTNQGQRVDNVRVQKTGQSFDKNGNKVPKQSEESHIPLDEFEKYNPERFK